MLFSADDREFINPLTHALEQTSLKAPAGALVLFAIRKGLREPNLSAYLDLSLMVRMPGKCSSSNVQQHSCENPRSFFQVLNRAPTKDLFNSLDRRREKEREYSRIDRTNRKYLLQSAYFIILSVECASRTNCFL